MAFYVPRTLEQFETRSRTLDPAREGPNSPNAFDRMERIRHTIPEAEVRQRLLERNGPQSGKHITVILGDAGDGKTSLALEWARQAILTHRNATHADPPVPLLARCGQLLSAARQRSEREFPWVLLDYATPAPPASLVRALRNNYGMVNGFLILDALDELPSELEYNLATSLNFLSMPVLITCRKADWEARWRNSIEAQHTEVLEIAPFRTEAEQQAFLSAWATHQNRPAPDEWADTVYAQIRGEPALIGLLENALTLSLTAEILEAHAGALPRTLDGFYQRAINLRWDRKLEPELTETDKDELSWQRDQLLAHLARMADTGKDMRTSFSFEDIMRASAAANLTRFEGKTILQRLLESGLFERKLSMDGAEYTFFQLKFQEYALVRAWMDDGVRREDAMTSERLTAKLVAYWADAEREQQLALALAYTNSRKVDLLPSIQALVQIGLDTPRAELFKIGRSPLRNALHLIARSGINMAGDLPRFLMRQVNSMERKLAIAVDPNTPVQILEELANNLNQIVRCGIAMNPSTPINYLYALSNDTFYKNVRSFVAVNANLNIEIIQRLALDESSIVRSRIAMNSNTPVEILRLLSGDKNENVRHAVAFNLKTPSDVLKSLSEDTKAMVREGVAMNSSTPDEILNLIERDEFFFHGIARNMTTTNDVLIDLAKHANSKVRQGVVGNMRTPIATLCELAQDTNPNVRGEVASNSRTPVTVLEELAQDQNPRILGRIAGNPNAPLTLLDRIAKNKYPEVREVVSRNPSVLLESLPNHNEET
jgi:hypothetical protein